MTGVFYFQKSMQQTENPFSESMQHKSDEQLLKIVGTGRWEYEALALEAAKLELRRRNIDPELIQQEDLPGQENSQAKSMQGFEWYHKAGMLLLPVFIGTLFHWLTSIARSGASLQFLGFPFLLLCYYWLHQQLKTNGYDRMARDFKSWTNYTLYIYIGVLLLGALVLLVAMMFASHR